MADLMVATLADCLAAVRAQVGGAEMRHAAAVRVEAAARADREAADRELLAADGEWTRQLAGGFDPMLGTLLAGEVRARASALVEADTACTQAQAAVAGTAEAWRGEDARRRALEMQAAAARRRARHHADERLLATLADRETFRRLAR